MTGLQALVKHLQGEHPQKSHAGGRGSGLKPQNLKKRADGTLVDKPNLIKGSVIGMKKLDMMNYLEGRKARTPRGELKKVVNGKIDTGIAGWRKLDQRQEVLEIMTADAWKRQQS